MGAGASAAEHSPRTQAVNRERRGSTILHNGTNDMIIQMLENRTGFDKSEIKTLQAKFMELAEKQVCYLVTARSENWSPSAKRYVKTLILLVAEP